MASQKAYIYYLGVTYEKYENLLDDDYESAIVIAPNRKVALNTHPSGTRARQAETGYLRADWPPHDDDSVTIERIGVAENKYVHRTNYIENLSHGYGYVICSIPDVS